MNHLDEKLETQIKHHLKVNGYEFVDLVAVPESINRMARLKNIEQILDDEGGAEKVATVNYILRCRPCQVGGETESKQAAFGIENIYGPAGKLNLPFLERSAQILVHSKEYGLARNIYFTLIRSGECAADVLSRAFCGLAACARGEEKLAEAVAHYEEALTFYAEYRVYQGLIEVYLQKKQPENALEMIDRALKIPDLDDVMRSAFCLAAAQARCLCGKDVEAQQWFEESIRFNSRNEAAQVGLGSVWYRTGKVRESYACLLAVLGSNPQNVEALFYLIKCAFSLGEYVEAERLVFNYTQVAPVNASLLYCLAGIQYHLGRKGLASSTVQQALRLRPDHEGAKRLLAKIQQTAVS